MRSTSSQFQRAAVDRVLAHLDERAAHRHAGHDLARDRAGRDAHGGLARRLAAAAAIVADAVFGVVGVVGVAGPVLVLDVGIVLGALVDIVDHQRDRRAGRHLPAARVVREHAGEDFHRVGLAPLRGEARLARPPLVEIGLDVGLGQRDARRAAVDHAADRRPVAFAQGRDAEKMAEGVERHGILPVARVVARASAGVKWAGKDGSIAGWARTPAGSSSGSGQVFGIVPIMTATTQKLLEQVASWPQEDQDELAEYARDIEARRSGVYRASPEELKAIDDADRSGVATDEEVEAAFRSFRRHEG